VTIPPNSRTILLVQLLYCRTIQVLLLEPLYNQNNLGVRVARTVVWVHGRKYCPVWNDTIESITLKYGTPIATVSTTINDKLKSCSLDESIQEYRNTKNKPDIREINNNNTRNTRRHSYANNTRQFYTNNARYYTRGSHANDTRRANANDTRHFQANDAPCSYANDVRHSNANITTVTQARTKLRLQETVYKIQPSILTTSASAFSNNQGSRTNNAENISRIHNVAKILHTRDIPHTTGRPHTREILCPRVRPEPTYYNTTNPQNKSLPVTTTNIPQTNNQTKHSGIINNQHTTTTTYPHTSQQFNLDTNLPTKHILSYQQLHLLPAQ